MPLTDTQKERLNQLKLAFAEVWRTSRIGFSFCEKVEERANDPDLDLTADQKIVLLAKAQTLIAAVNTANVNLQILK